MLVNSRNAFVSVLWLCLGLATVACTFDIDVGPKHDDGGSGGTGGGAGGSGGSEGGSGGSGGSEGGSGGSGGSEGGSGGSGGGGGSEGGSGGSGGGSGGSGGSEGGSGGSGGSEGGSGGSGGSEGGSGGSGGSEGGSGGSSCGSSDVTLTPDGGDYTVRNGSGEVVATLSVPVGALVEHTCAAVGLGVPPELPDTLEVVSEALVIDLEDGSRLQLGVATALRVAELPPDPDAFWILAATDLGIRPVEALRFHDDDGTPTVEFDIDAEGTYFVVRTSPQNDCSEMVIDEATVSDAADLAALAGVTRVRGDLLVQLDSGHDVTSLEPLRCLAQVDGELELSDTSSEGPLVDLSLLSQLTLVRGRLHVDIPSLQSAAFPVLIGANGDVEFVGSGELALGMLSHIGGTFFLAGNVFTASLPILRVVGGDLIVYRTRLQSFYAPLVEVGARLRFVENAGLANLGALASLRRVGHSVGLSGNEPLKQINFTELTELGDASGHRSMVIQGHRVLESFTAPLVKLLGRFVFHWNGRIGTDLTFEVPQLAEAGPISIYMVDGQIPSFNFPKLEVVHGDFEFAYVHGVAGLVSISFEALRRIHGKLAVEDVDELSVPELTLVRGLELRGTGIKTFVAPKLETIAGDLRLQSNYSLKTWTSDVLNEVTGDLVFILNGSPTTFSMSRLAEIAGNFQLYSNSEFTSLDGFPSLEKVGGNFDVQRNVKLPTCEAFELLEQVQEYNEITGSITISENLADDCGS